MPTHSWFRVSSQYNPRATSGFLSQLYSSSLQSAATLAVPGICFLFVLRFVSQTSCSDFMFFTEQLPNTEVNDTHHHKKETEPSQLPLYPPPTPREYTTRNWTTLLLLTLHFTYSTFTYTTFYPLYFYLLYILPTLLLLTLHFTYHDYYHHHYKTSLLYSPAWDCTTLLLRTLHFTYFTFTSSTFYLPLLVQENHNYYRNSDRPWCT